MQDTAGEVKANSGDVLLWTLHMDEQGLGDLLEPIYNSSVLIQDVAWKACRERLAIRTSSGRGLGKSVPAARHDIFQGSVLGRVMPKT